MKKIIMFCAFALASIGAMATDYTDTLEVTVNGVATTQTAKIFVDKQDNGKYNLQLNNFVLNMMGVPMYVGNINLADVEGTTTGDLTTLNFNSPITITAGDDPAQSWIGPMLGEVPVSMTAELRGDELYTVIDITMASLNQTIQVVFGNGGYQIGNSGFENFHTATLWSPQDPELNAQSDEPDHWHSFMSTTSYLADGTSAPIWGWLAGGGLSHTWVSDIVRPGTTGRKSVLVTSTDMGFTVANGTITTGRLNAASMSATDPVNHSWLCMDSTAVDDHGDPFYTRLNGLPDSVTVWVKFKQGTPVAEHPYATVNAVITDGTYYQDPEDKEYTNVLAKATDVKIESKDFAWQKVRIPFVYTEDLTDDIINGRKGLLVTISTNADPGCGSNDSIYVDDIQLVYGSKPSSITVKGQTVELKEGVNRYDLVNRTNEAPTADDITVASASKGLRVATHFEPCGDCGPGAGTVTVTTTSADLRTSNIYTIDLKSASGVSNVENASDGKASAIYNLNGQRIGKAAPGQVYIEQLKGGKTVKRIEK